ncbi:MAG TPA: serine hydrolase domain-containing protein [Acidobacteriota bacterium]
MNVSLLLDYLNHCIRCRLFPGCAVAFGTSKSEPRVVVSGQLTYQAKSHAVDVDTWYDLASLTKPIATVSSFLTAVQHGKLHLETSVSHFFPQAICGNAQIRHLLSHSSGLPAYRPFFRFCHSAEEVVGQIVRCQPEFTPGSKSVYSDLGFILLGRIMELLFEQRFRQLVQENVLNPLKLRAIQFGPLSGDRPSSVTETPGSSGQECPAAAERKVAPTELDFRLHGFAVGVVHDENARLFDGAAGHAGLFGTIQEVARFPHLILSTTTMATDAAPLQHQLSPELLRSWTRRQQWLPQSSWGLGWDTQTPDSSAGPALSASSFGHTGFTGTSMWIDPEQDLYVCILSNRVHPSRKIEGMKEARRQIHALAVKALRGEEL